VRRYRGGSGTGVLTPRSPFGTGHFHMTAEEFYARAGGPAEVQAVLGRSLALHEGPSKSSVFERLGALLVEQVGIRRR